MRTRLTKEAMGLNDSPTTMHVKNPNPPVEKYKTGDPAAWAEAPHTDKPWDQENAAGREETGHPKMKSYASMVREAKDLEEKALRCLKMAETILPDAPADVIERQAVDFMSMSGKSVLSTLRRMREFEDTISETRVAKIVDAVMEVISEEEEEEEEKEEKVEKESAKEEKEEEEVEEKVEKESSEEKTAEEEKISTIIEAVLEVMAEEKQAAEKKQKEEDDKESVVASVVEAVLEVLAEEDKEEKEPKEEKEAGKKSEDEPEEKEEEMVEEKETKEEKEAGKKSEDEPEEKEEEMVEEPKEKEAGLDISFDEIGDVMASQEDVNVLSQIFSAADEEKVEEKKEAKIKTLKNVTASKGVDEISKLSSLWHKEY